MFFSPLKVDVRYFPFEMPTQWAVPTFRHDEVKMNLLWLVCPEIDKLVEGRWEGNDVTNSINIFLDMETREILKTLSPVDFMTEFAKSHSEYEMSEGWPSRYIDTMWARARLAERRLLGDNSNVVNVDFKRRKIA